MPISRSPDRRGPRSPPLRGRHGFEDCRRPRSPRPAGQPARCSRASGTPSSGTVDQSRLRGRVAAPIARPATAAGRRPRDRRRPARSPRAGGSARPGRASTARRRCARRRRRARRAGAPRRRSCAGCRPMHSRSGRSQNVSPPSIVPGASIRPTVGIPWASVHASITAGSPSRFGLPGPQRDRAAVGHEQRVERVDEVRAVDLGLEVVDRRPESARAAATRGRARAARSRLHGWRNPWAGSSNARPNAGPGRLTSTSRSGAVMLWAPKARSTVVTARG